MLRGAAGRGKQQSSWLVPQAPRIEEETQSFDGAWAMAILISNLQGRTGAMRFCALEIRREVLSMRAPENRLDIVRSEDLVDAEKTIVAHPEDSCKRYVLE